jgi:CBS domain-containing protein
MFISILRAFFNQMWLTGIETARRIEEIKTGVPIGETLVIKDPGEAWLKVEQMLDNAKQDVILIAPSQSINGLVEKDLFAKHHKTGVTFRLMAPLDLDNLEAAKKLSTNYEIKHVPINYMTMLLVDDKNLFMFKSPPIDDVSDESLFYLNETVFTNDPRQTERVSEMLNDTWKRGMDLSEITSQAAGMKLPTFTISLSETAGSLVSMVLKNKINSVLITENGNAVGLINDRDLLKEVVEARKDPEKTRIKDLDYTPLLTLEKNQTMTDALKIVREKATKRAAVVKDGQLMGMLTLDVAMKLAGTAKQRTPKK